MIEKIDEIQEQLAGAEKVLVGLGEEWKWNRQGEDAKERREELVRAYEKLYQMLQNKDYFIVTLATDALIYETSLGSKAENVISTDKEEDAVSCPSENAETLAVMERLFPSKKRPEDTRWQRIVAPCGNETWRQCSAACTMLRQKMRWACSVSARRGGRAMPTPPCMWPKPSWLLP